MAQVDRRLLDLKAPVHQIGHPIVDAIALEMDDRAVAKYPLLQHQRKSGLSLRAFEAGVVR